MFLSSDQYGYILSSAEVSRSLYSGQPPTPPASDTTALLMVAAMTEGREVYIFTGEQLISTKFTLTIPVLKSN